MNLDEILRQHYSAKTLRPAVRQGLLAEASERRGASGRRGRGLRTAAVVLALALPLALLGLAALDSSIRHEVAENQLKQRAPEFDRQAVGELQPLMADLDFALVESRRVRERQLRVVGARYCSIQGQLAAQLQLEDAQGARWTLFQAPLRGRLRATRSSVESLEGVRVELWRESGVLLALASDGEDGSSADAP